MKIVKQMLMHLGALYEKSYTRRAYSASFTLKLCLQHLKRLRSPNSMFLTKRHPPGFSDS